MSDMSNFSLIKEMLDSAESSIRSAKQLLSETSGIPIVSRKKYIEKAGTVDDESPLNEPEGRIIQGVFNGQSMVDKDENVYPVPANYASKSKLVPGDILKLTITDEGKFIYKQIGPVARKTVIGPLIFEDGQYRILANGKSYKVLLASVTYFKADVGDEVTLIIPADEDTEWGAIEAVLPEFTNIAIEDDGMIKQIEEEEEEEEEEEIEEKSKRGRKKKKTEEE